MNQSVECKLVDKIHKYEKRISDLEAKVSELESILKDTRKRNNEDKKRLIDMLRIHNRRISDDESKIFAIESEDTKFRNRIIIALGIASLMIIITGCIVSKTFTIVAAITLLVLLVYLTFFMKIE